MQLGAHQLGTAPLGSGGATLVEVGPIEVHASPSLEWEVIRRDPPASATPEVKIGLDKTAFEMVTTGFGVTIGAVIPPHIVPAIIGGTVGSLWGRYQWRKAHPDGN